MGRRGQKHICHVCSCKFYDLNRPNPVCPRCGAKPQKMTLKELTLVDKAVGPVKKETGDLADLGVDSEVDFEENIWDSLDGEDEEILS